MTLARRGAKTPRSPKPGRGTTLKRHRRGFLPHGERKKRRTPQLQRPRPSSQPSLELDDPEHKENGSSGQLTQSCPLPSRPHLPWPMRVRWVVPPRNQGGTPPGSGGIPAQAGACADSHHCARDLSQPGVESLAQPGPRACRGTSPTRPQSLDVRLARRVEYIGTIGLRAARGDGWRVDRGQLQPMPPALAAGGQRSRRSWSPIRQAISDTSTRFFSRHVVRGPGSVRRVSHRGAPLLRRLQLRSLRFSALRPLPRAAPAQT